MLMVSSTGTFVNRDSTSSDDISLHGGAVCSKSINSVADLTDLPVGTYGVRMEFNFFATR